MLESSMISVDLDHGMWRRSLTDKAKMKDVLYSSPSFKSLRRTTEATVALTPPDTSFPTASEGP